MRIFVAGATGAIGRQLIPRLRAAGHDVYGMTRDATKRPMLRRMGAIPLVADALVAHEVRDAVAKASPEVIVHELTSIGSVDTRHMERDLAATNLLRIVGTNHLLEAARASGVRRFVAQSNVAIYARHGGWVKGEDAPVDDRPARQMLQNVRAMVHLENAVTGASPIEGIVLRYGWFYGPGTSLAADGETFELIRRRRFPVVGNGSGVWSFIHIADAAAATQRAIESAAPGIYNIVDDEPAAVSDWLPELARMLRAPKPLHVPRFVGRLFAGEAGVVMMTETRGASNAKAKQLLQWEPDHPTWRRGFVDADGPTDGSRATPSAASHIDTK